MVALKHRTMQRSPPLDSRFGSALALRNLVNGSPTLPNSGFVIANTRARH